MPPELPPPSVCKICRAPVRWALHVERYKKLPMEAEPISGAPWVLMKFPKRRPRPNDSATLPRFPPLAELLRDGRRP